VQSLSVKPSDNGLCARLLRLKDAANHTVSRVCACGRSRETCPWPLRLRGRWRELSVLRVARDTRTC